MDNQNNMNGNNNPNNNVIRSTNIRGGYESLDDDLTKEQIEKQKKERSYLDSEMNMMNNIVSSAPIQEPKEENFLDKVKNKGIELKNKGMSLFNKLRGDTRTSLSDSSLSKMNEFNNKQARMENYAKEQSNQQVNQQVQQPVEQVQQVQQPVQQVQQQMPQQMPQQPMMNQMPQQMPQQPMMNQMPQQMPQQPMMNNQGMMQQPMSQQQVNNRIGKGKVSKQDVFAGLPTTNQNKGGFLNRLFHKNDVQQNPQDVVEPWMLNQPLSAKSLGISDNEVKKDTVVYENNQKYFNASSDVARVSEDNSLHPENFAKPVFQRKVREMKNNGTLIHNYLGNDYDSVAMGVFSFSAFFFGGLYYIKHKLFIAGLALFAAQMYILCFIPWKTGLIIYGVMSLVLAFISNPIIMMTVKARVSLMRSTHPKYVELQLNELARIRGKKCGSLAFLILVAALGCAAFVYFSQGVKFKGALGKGFNYIEKMAGSSVKSSDIVITYNDELSPTSYFTYKLPEVYKKEKDLNVYKRVTENEGDNNYCQFSFRAIKNYKDANSLLNDIKKKNNASSSVKTEEHNGVLFNALEYSIKSGKYYYLSVKADDVVYLLEFVSGENTPLNVCDNDYKDIVNNIKKIEVKKAE